MAKSLVDSKQSLEKLLEPFTGVQRQYISLLLANFSPSDARGIVSRRPSTVDTWLVESDFAEVKEFILLNKKKYQDEALAVWAKNLSLKAKVFLERTIDLGLKELNEKDRDNPFLKIAMQAAGILSKVAIEKPGSYDELILRKRREV